MEMLKHTCSFSNGMNKDLSVNQYPNTCYFDAQNLRLITGDSAGLTSEDLVTPKGNAVSFTLPTNMVMLGHVVLRDYLIILAHDITVGSNPDKIYRIPISSLTTAGNLIIDNIYYWIGGTHYLVYEQDLGFNLNYPIRIVGNYENTNTQKIYWCDGLNTLKHLNLIYNTITNDLSILDPELLEILPDNVYGTYTLTEGIGGNLKAGRIQYSYQLYSIAGTETLFAPASNLYNLVSYEPTDGVDFIGNELETTINKSINLTINLPTGTSTTFNRIRVVALEYEIYGDVPIVRVFGEKELTSNTFTITDVGNKIAELTLEEFQLIRHDFIPHTLESKNNYLFAGNITEEFFDIDDLVYELNPTDTFFDSRAYRWRFNSATGLYDCTINKGDTTEAIIDNGSGGGPDYTIVTETNDCLNKYNDIINDTNTLRTYEYKYKYGGANPPIIDNLGGSGRIISYGFTTNTISAATEARIGYNGAIYTLIPNIATPGYADPSNIVNYTSYPRDEVMRFAIVVFDLKGRPSYPKWIADIRMPDIVEELNPATTYDTTYNLTSGASSNLVVKALGVQFTINWDNINTDYPGLLSLISGYQIVRVPRTTNDSTILTQGIVLPTHHATNPAGQIQHANYSSYNIHSARDYVLGGAPSSIASITGGWYSIDKTLVELISPEIAINKNLILDTTNDFIEVIGTITNVSIGIDTEIVTSHKGSYSVKASTITGLQPTPTLISDWRRTLVDGFISTPEIKSPPPHIVDTTAYVARGYDDDATGNNPNMTFKGTSLVLKLSSAFANTIASAGAAGTEEAIYARYRRYKGTSIYGGATYSERTYNSYIKAGEVTQISNSGSTTISVYNGDTYISPFGFAKLFVDLNAEYGTFPDAYTGQSIVYFPVESKINLNYRLDRFNKYLTGTRINITTNSNYQIAENQSVGVSQFPNYYPQPLGDLYRYNSAYSAEDMSKIYVAKPFDFQISKTNDVMVTSSELKFTGEYRDSWLNFKYNNYIELSGDCGPLIRIVSTSGDKLICFQDRGIAVLSVLERELVNTQNTGALSVGTGGVLSRYDYISNTSGTSLYDSIAITDGGIYYFDDKNKLIQRITNTVEPLSDIKGLKSFLAPRRITGMIAAYDKENREVIFTPTVQAYISGLDSCTTICLSGYKDVFTGFYTYGTFTETSKYITFDKYLLSSQDANVFYLHNVGNYNQFFGNNLTSSLTLIVNPNKSQPVSFQTIEWLMDVTNSGVEVAGETFDSVQITNTYQDTGVLTLPGSTGLMRRFRTWRINVFRDSLIANSYGRIRDSWIKAKFSYTPSNTNDKALVHPIDFFIQPTKIR